MAFHRITSEQKLPISMQDAWAFFSSPKNLNVITPKEMSFEITNDPAPKMFEGQIITYKVSPILGNQNALDDRNTYGERKLVLH